MSTLLFSKFRTFDERQFLLTILIFRLLQLTNDNVNRDLTQELFDLANYTVEAKSGEEVVEEVKETLSKYFVQIPMLLPDGMVFSPYFKQKVSFEESIVKISDEIPRNLPQTINTVVYTKELDKVFRENMREDKSLRWQYFGSSAGLIRLWPAREWDTNFAGFYNDYDPRVRNWYIAATSGPKDVIIIIDCSLSMKGTS